MKSSNICSLDCLSVLGHNASASRVVILHPVVRLVCLLKAACELGLANLLHISFLHLVKVKKTCWVSFDFF